MPEDTISVPFFPNLDTLSARMEELSKTYRVICMSPEAYSIVRRYGRDRLSIVTGDGDDPSVIPFEHMAAKAGLTGGFYSNLPLEEEGVEWPVGKLLEQADWALIISRRSVPDGFLRVATALGEPWQDLPI